jgi:hypothetical protein
VNGIQASKRYTAIGGQNSFTALVEPAPDEILEYSWNATTGVLQQTTGNSVIWQAPAIPSVGEISVLVTNQEMLSKSASIGVLTKDTTMAIQTPLIWYPFDSDNRNAAADRFHATVSGATKTDDARSMPLLAYRFTSGNNIIYTDNHNDLNFADAVSLSCWVKCEQLGSERFIISHGSWQQRYKLSITPEGLLRWTVKTNSGVADLDGSTPIELNRYYHVSALFTGYSMELYVDGVLDSFKSFSGSILASTKPFTIGRMDNVETQYALLGSVDEVKLWDKEIPVGQVEQLMNQWAPSAGIIDIEINMCIYPNPAGKAIFVEFFGATYVDHISLLTMNGENISDYTVKMEIPGIIFEFPETTAGLYLLRIALKNGRLVTRKIIIL